MPAQALRALTTGFALSGSSHASCSLSKGIIRVVDLFEVMLPVGDPAEQPEPTLRRAVPDLVRDEVPPAPARETEACRGLAG